MILLNILEIFDFWTFRTLAGMSKWSNLQNILMLFLFDLLLGGHTVRFYWIYRFFSTFRPWTGEGEAVTGRGGKSMVRVVISRKNQACKNERVDVTSPNVFCKKYRWHRSWLFQCNTRNKDWHNNIIGFVHPIEERSLNIRV